MSLRAKEHKEPHILLKMFLSCLACDSVLRDFIKVHVTFTKIANIIFPNLQSLL